MRPDLAVPGYEEEKGNPGRVENRFGEGDTGGSRPHWVVFGYECG